MIADPKMIGTPIRYCGRIYVISDVNYLGDYGVIRYVAARRVWQRTSIQPEQRAKSDMRHWEVVGPWHKKRLRYAILQSERLHSRYEVRSKSAKAWRRARARRTVLKRFFQRIQARPKQVVKQ